MSQIAKGSHRVIDGFTLVEMAVVLAGSSLSSAMEGVSPVFTLRIICVGERSGMLGKSLHDIADA